MKKLLLSLCIVASVTFSLSFSFQQRETETNWYGVYIGNNKVGWTNLKESSITENGNNYIKKESISFTKVNRLGSNPVEISSNIEFYFTRNLKPVKGTIKNKFSLNSITHELSFTQKTIEIYSYSYRDTTYKKISIPDDFYVEFPFKDFFSKQQIKAGKSFSYKTLNVEIGLNIIEEEIRIIEKESISVMGEIRELWHCEQLTKLMGGITAHNWIDDEGIVWKSSTAMGGIAMSMIKMNKFAAQKESETQFDIALSTSLKPNIPIQNPQKVIYMKTKITGIDPETAQLLPRDETQKITSDEKGDLVITTQSLIPENFKPLQIPVKDIKYRKYLTSTQYCQSDDPEIRKIAERITGDEKNALNAAKKIAFWLDNNLTPDYSVGFATSKEILSERRGDCTEYSILMVTLCRAAGIPAKANVGIMCGRGIFAYHMWTEVYVGKWLPLDPKWISIDPKSKEPFVDATHIKFSQSELGDNLLVDLSNPLIKILGKIKLEIINYKSIE